MPTLLRDRRGKEDRPMPDYPAPLRRKRAFRWLLGGSSVSMLGSRLTAIAYPMLILFLHGSPVAAGLAVFAANAPSFLLYIPAGALVDRWNPRWTLALAEVGRGIAIGLIVTMLLLHQATVPLVIGAAILEEGLEVFAMLAERRYVRVLVDPGQASSALVSIETRTHIVLTVGRALGGLLFGIAQVLPFLADMVSFVASVSSLVIGKPGHVEIPERARDSKLTDEVRDGLRTLFRDRFARDASLLSAYLTLLSQALIIVFLAGTHSRQVTSVAVGIVLAASGIGGVAGALVAKQAWRLADQSPLQMQPVVWFTMFAVLSLSGRWQVQAMAIAMAVLGFSGALSNVELDSHLFAYVPVDKQARVASIGMLIEFGACALGSAFGGVIAEFFGPGPAVWVLFGLTMPCVLFGLRLRAPSQTLALTNAAGASVALTAPSSDTLQSQGTSV
jgi:MFS family permease